MTGVPLPAHARDVISRDQFPVARRSDGSCWRTLGTRDVGRMIKLKVALREAARQRVLKMMMMEMEMILR